MARGSNGPRSRWPRGRHSICQSERSGWLTVAGTANQAKTEVSVSPNAAWLCEIFPVECEPTMIGQTTPNG